MRRIAFLLTLALSLGLVLVAGIDDASAQSLVPCCEGGGQPNKKCNTDQNCKGVCVGGARDGRVCRDDSKCPGACLGGTKDGWSCRDAADCPGGSCGPAGSCDPGTCTGLCTQGKPPKSPSEPASEWLEIDSARRLTVARTCP